MSSSKFERLEKQKAAVFIAAACIITLYALFSLFFGQGSSAPPLAENTADIHFLSVGQGDCALVRTSDGVALIDCGTEESADHITAYLEKYRIKEITYLFLTHPHSDHIGGAPAVLAAFDVKNVVVTSAPGDDASYEALKTALESGGITPVSAFSGDVFTLGGAVFTVLSPDKGSADTGNDASLIIKIEYQSSAVLMTGDAEKAEAKLPSVYGAESLRCDILKVAHHGSATSTSDALLDAAQAKYAVVSCGKNNAFGHPDASVLSRLDKHGVAVYRTDEQGDLRFVLDGKTAVYSPTGKGIMSFIEKLYGAFLPVSAYIG